MDHICCNSCGCLYSESGVLIGEIFDKKAARQPSRWRGRYSIRGSIWTPEGRCVDYEMDLTEARGETFLELIGSQFKESDDEPKPIPENLPEAVKALDDMGEMADVDRLMQSVAGLDPHEQEQRFLAETHHGIGQWIRNNWGLWTGSTLRNALVELGLTHADDMSGLILTCYIRKKLGRPLDIEGQVEKYRAFWAGEGTDGD